MKNKHDITVFVPERRRRSMLVTPGEVNEKEIIACKNGDDTKQPFICFTYFHKHFQSKLLDSVSLHFASLKTGNDLVTELQRKQHIFTLWRLRQARTATT
jgi:hypothetical protein